MAVARIDKPERPERPCVLRDRPQPIVLDALVVRRFVCVGREALVDIVRQRLGSGTPAEAVDGLEATG